MHVKFRTKHLKFLNDKTLLKFGTTWPTRGPTVAPPVLSQCPVLSPCPVSYPPPNVKVFCTDFMTWSRQWNLINVCYYYSTSIQKRNPGSVEVLKFFRTVQSLQLSSRWLDHHSGLIFFLTKHIIVGFCQFFLCKLCFSVPFALCWAILTGTIHFGWTSFLYWSSVKIAHSICCTGSK